MNRSLMNNIRSRASTDGAFRHSLESAWQEGGLTAAAGVARAHGFAVPSADGELSDLELEQVAGGKGSVWIVPW